MAWPWRNGPGAENFYVSLWSDCFKTSHVWWQSGPEHCYSHSATCWQQEVSLVWQTSSHLREMFLVLSTRYSTWGIISGCLLVPHSGHRKLTLNSLVQFSNCMKIQRCVNWSLSVNEAEVAARPDVREGARSCSKLLAAFILKCNL